MRVNALFLSVVFVICVVVIFYITKLSSDPESIYQDIEENLDQLISTQRQDLNEFEDQFAVYSNPFAISDNEEFVKRVFVNGTLVYWNSNEYLPGYTQIKKEGNIYTLKTDQGILLVQRREVVADTDLVEIFSIVDIYYNPRVKNQYLQDKLNPQIFDTYPVVITDDGSHTFDYEGRVLFSIKLIEDSSLWNELISFLFFVIATACLVLFTLNLNKVRQLAEGYKAVIITVLFVGIRIISWYWTKDHLTHWDIFKPIYFTAEPIFYSMGDILYHCILLFIWLIILYKKFYLKKTSKGPPGFGVKRLWRGILWSLIVMLLAYLSYQCVWLVLEHSQIDLDIAHSIQFDELRFYAYLLLVLMGLSMVLAFSMSIRSFSTLYTRPGFQYTIIILSYLLFGIITRLWVVGEAFALTWLLIDFFGFSRKLRIFRYKTFVYLIILVAAYASVCAYAIYRHAKKDDLVAKEKFANRLLIKNDILGELYLSEIIKDIEDDRYVRTRLLSKLLSMQNIQDKIKRQFLSSYFKKYDIEVLLFDVEGQSLQPDVSANSFVRWEEKYKLDSLATDYKKIYFVQGSGENVRNKYVCFLNIEAYGRHIGSIVLDLTLKKFIPTSMFPELLLESRFFMEGTNEFDYAVYQCGQILYKQGRFSFENKFSSEDLKRDQLYEEGMERDGTHYYGLKTQDGRDIIIISPTYENSALVANFSFIFLILLFASGLAFVVVRIFTRAPQFNLSTKIQLYIGLSFILPMLIVSIALLNTLNRSYREEIDRNFQKRSFNLAENLIDPTEAFAKNQINIDEYANAISEVGTLAQSDVNIYDLKGRLITSSQPEIFRLGLLSNLIDPKAFREIRYNREQNLISEQSIGALDFKTSYTALRAYEDGSLLGILAMPYFDSKNHLRNQQVKVFGNLISIFTIIFLISVFVGNVIVNNLVRPLKKIGEKLRSTSLEEENKPILYESEDEIGSLIREYNLMLLKLEESKCALAVSQKEAAWKEIARQVAHEIKNPITPMRLKIQQMMRAFDPADKNYKTCLTLIDQIDTLSSIADSFSEFAKMPAPNNKPTDICKLLHRVIGLYQSNDVVIRKDFDKKCSVVYVDPKIFNGIFTNILLNAIQSVEGKKPEISIIVREAVAKVLISIEDNGQGIAGEIKENIFTPYFSTKTQGSGIGLAVAKKGIENAGGSIWFESKEGEGTTFFISLPVYNRKT